MSSKRRKEKQGRWSFLNSPFFHFGGLASVFRIMPRFTTEFELNVNSAHGLIYIEYN